jgi:hypothetical protein
MLLPSLFFSLHPSPASIPKTPNSQSPSTEEHLLLKVSPFPLCFPADAIVPPIHASLEQLPDNPLGPVPNKMPHYLQKFSASRRIKSGLGILIVIKTSRSRTLGLLLLLSTCALSITSPESRCRCDFPWVRSDRADKLPSSSTASIQLSTASISQTFP